MTSKAPFIVLDGVDGAGKSTQTRLLLEWLRDPGISAIRCADPGGTPLGDKLRAILLDRDSPMTMRAEALLFMAARAELVEKTIRPSLADSIVVICDRFVLANVVYQGHAGGLDPEELWQMGHFATSGLEPDLTFVFDLSVEAAEARRGKPTDRFETRDRAYREKVREGFLFEVRRRPERYALLDASAPIEELQNRLRQRVGDMLRL